MTTHECPGCHNAQIEYNKLACKPCWYRLPASLRRQINGAWRLGVLGRAAHVKALREALAWYREHPA